MNLVEVFGIFKIISNLSETCLREEEKKLRWQLKRAFEWG